MFKSFEDDTKYGLIIVDEAQNFSLCQLKNIHQLAINSQVLYCMDPQQNIYDSNAIRKLFQQLFWSEQSGLQIKTINLDKTYRCAKKIVETINVILAAKHKIMAKIDKEEANNLLVDESGEVGYVALTSPQKLHEYQEILDRYVSPEFAVVTHENLVAEAREIFKTPLVFTIQQIQGLDYHTVVIYRLFQKNKSISQESKNIFNLLQADKLTKEDKNTNVTYAAWFHQLYTAFTRAKHTLLIIEENIHQNPIYQMLKATFDKAQNNIEANLNQDWDRELETQQVKNPSVAQQIKKLYQNSKKQKKNAGDEVLETLSLNPESKITKESHTSQSYSSEITDEKIEDKNLLVAKAKSIYENFTKNKIRDEIGKEDFHELLFATKFCLDTEKEHEGKTLFARIIENVEYARRFSVIISLDELGKNNEFILRIIDYENNPDIITEKLMGIIFTKNFRAFTDEKISDWIDKKFVASEIAKNKIATDIIKIAHSLWLDEFLGVLELVDKENWHFPKAFAEIITSASEDCSNTPLYILTKYPKGLEILDYLIKIDNVIDNIPIDAWHFQKNYLTEALCSTPFINLTKTEQAISIFEKLIDKKKEIIKMMDPKYWGLVYLDNINFNSLLNNLVTSDKGLEILSKLINESVIKTIPLYAWGNDPKISFGQFDNICISPLDYLQKLSKQEDFVNHSVTKVNLAKNILETLLKIHGDNFFSAVNKEVAWQNLKNLNSIPKKLSKNSGVNLNLNIEKIYQMQNQMIDKAKQIYLNFNKNFIDSEKNSQYFHELLFVTKFSLENDGLYKTLFEQIISNETYVDEFALSLTAYPQNKLVDFIEKAMEYENLPPVIIKKLILEIFTNDLFVFIKQNISSWIDKNFDHLITEQRNIADYLINNSCTWLNFFWVMTEALPIENFFFPKAFSKILCSKGKTTLITPLYRLTEDDLGLRVLSFLIDFPDVIDNIDLEAWHDVASGTDKPGQTHKTPFYNLSKNERALLVFDKFISKRYEIIKKFPLKEWGSLFMEKGENLSFYCVLENLVIYDTGLKILSKLLDHKDSLVVESEFLYYWRSKIHKVSQDGVAKKCKYGFYEEKHVLRKTICRVLKSPFEHLLEYAASSNASNDLPKEVEIKAKLATEILEKLNQIAKAKRGLTFAELSEEAYNQHVEARDNTPLAKIYKLST